MRQRCITRLGDPSQLSSACPSAASPQQPSASPGNPLGVHFGNKARSPGSDSPLSAFGVFVYPQAIPRLPTWASSRCFGEHRHPALRWALTRRVAKRPGRALQWESGPRSWPCHLPFSRSCFSLLSNGDKILSCSPLWGGVSSIWISVGNLCGSGGAPGGRQRRERCWPLPRRSSRSLHAGRPPSSRQGLG